MEDIETELEQKSIEKVEETIIDEPQPVQKKTKKVRSEAQKAAFERAKIKRAENIKKRRELKEQEKIEKKATKTKITERVKEEIKQSPKQVTSIPTGPHHSSTRPLARQTAVRDEPIINPRENIVQNHYYYYGGAPPAPQPVQFTQEPKRKKKGRKSRRPPTPSSSSEEEFSDIDEPETYQDQYHTEPQVNYDIEPETKIPKLKFNFA